MNYSLIKDVLDLLEKFEKENIYYNGDIEGFKKWISDNIDLDNIIEEPNWEGKHTGRSPESVISTLLVHMNRYAKNYSKSAMYDSEFSTQDEFIYLINLKAFGQMTKTELIKKNIHDKTQGMQIINRLIGQKWVEQENSPLDKRSKIIRITTLGLEVLDMHMSKIRQATNMVTGDLTQREKMELIRLLNKLDHFHKPIYHQNIDSEHLLEQVKNLIPQKKK